MTNLEELHSLATRLAGLTTKNEHNRSWQCALHGLINQIADFHSPRHNKGKEVVAIRDKDRVPVVGDTVEFKVEIKREIEDTCWVSRRTMYGLVTKIIDGYWWRITAPGGEYDFRKDDITHVSVGEE